MNRGYDDPGGWIETAPAVRPARGTIRLDGGKHSFAHMLACAALAERGELTRVPDHVDARTLRAALGLVFGRSEYDADQRVLCYGDPRSLDPVRVPASLTARSRNLFGLYPALLCRTSELVVEQSPTGCAIGSRPSDWYLDLLRRFGVRIQDEPGLLRMSWPDRRPGTVSLGYPTMTGTVLAVALGAAAGGRTTIHNPSVEPSVTDQLECLRGMGAGVTTPAGMIEIDSPGGFDAVSDTVRHDRIHAVTYLTAGLLTRGEVRVVGHGDLRVPRFAEFLRSAGCWVSSGVDWLAARLPDRGVLDACEVRAGSEPWFSSDWLPFAALLMALRSEGVSRFVDDVFPGRLQFFDRLRGRGVDSVAVGRTTLAGRQALDARIEGRPDGQVHAGVFRSVPDIRGSVALVLALLTSDGTGRLLDDFHVRRGHTDLAGDLRSLGLDVKRGDDSHPEALPWTG